MAPFNSSKALQVESLEERVVMTTGLLPMPAGNVAAYMNQGILELRGDGLSNNVDVTQITDQRFQVSGMNGTRINGGSATLVLSGVLDLDAKLRDGNDTITVNILRNASIRNVTIDMGMGQFEKVVIQGGESIDGLNVSCRGLNALDLSTGGRSLFVNGQTKITGGNSTTQGDRIYLLGYFNSVSIETGDGDDVIRLGTKTSVSNIVRFNATKVNAKTGNGNDEINLLRAEIDQLFADLAGGDDIIALSIVRFSPPSDGVLLNGRTGTDTVRELNSITGGYTLGSFEVRPA